MAGHGLTQSVISDEVSPKPVLWADCANNFMRQHGIMPTPQNYQLWYTYVTGDHSALMQDVQVLQARKTELSEDVCAKLYTKHFSVAQDAALLHETNRKVQHEIDTVLSHLKTAESDTLRFGNTLSGYSDDIATLTDTDRLRSYVDSLLLETKTMAEKSRSLEGELKKSSQEIGRLKESLEVARLEAITDELTGIGNRKQFDHSIESAIKEATAHPHQPLSLIFGDVDYFKSFNDTWGHKLGDHVLKLVAAHMREISPENGMPTRYGGEEFAIILPNTPVAAAAVIADRLRLSISKKVMKAKATGVTLGRVTMSFGVTQYAPGEELDELVARVDRALYAAKGGGRNKVVTLSV